MFDIVYTCLSLYILFLLFIHAFIMFYAYIKLYVLFLNTISNLNYFIISIFNRILNLISWNSIKSEIHAVWFIAIYRLWIININMLLKYENLCMNIYLISIFADVWGTLSRNSLVFSIRLCASSKCLWAINTSKSSDTSFNHSGLSSMFPPSPSSCSPNAIC